MVQLSTTQTHTHTNTNKNTSIRTGEDGEHPRASSRLKAAAIVLIEKAQEARGCKATPLERAICTDTPQKSPSAATQQLLMVLVCTCAAGLRIRT